MNPNDLHSAARTGDLPKLLALLEPLTAASPQLEARDEQGRTALMCAVASSSFASPLSITQALINAGANVNATTNTSGIEQYSVLTHALRAGDPSKVSALLDAGAILDYNRNGYGALLDALYDRDIRLDARLIDLLDLLVQRGARLNDISSYKESALRTLSRIGRFDAVALLLRAGADESQLQWTPLIRATALGTIDDLRAEIPRGSLEDRDWWSRTAWHVALLVGHVEKAKLLQAHGCDMRALGRCGAPPLFFAIRSLNAAMVDYVIATGAPIEKADDFGGTSLMEAVEYGNLTAVDQLIKAGAAVDFEKVWSLQADESITPEMAQRMNEEARGTTALREASDPAIARRLIAAGADPQHLSFEVRRALLGLPPEPATRLFDASREEFHRSCHREFGTSNPQPMNRPGGLAMIRSGISGFQAADHFGSGDCDQEGPVWCAQRFGQSITFLPDGRIVQIAGEHEDSYDADFCIYNDVFVHDPDGTITIYGYPEDVFPPTDFHTATLIGDTIYLIGSLGYQGTRMPGSTPVFALDTRTFRIERLHASGVAPGWIYKHRADRRGEDEILVSGGMLVTDLEGKEQHSPLGGVFVLDVRELRWVSLHEASA